MVGVEVGVQGRDGGNIELEVNELDQKGIDRAF